MPWKQILRGKNAIPRQDIQYRGLGKEGLGEVHQVGDDVVFGIRPERRKLKAVAGLAALSRRRRVEILDMPQAGGVGIILRIRSVGDNEYLHIVKKPAACPKAVALIAIDLVERLADSHAPPLQLHMDEGQPVDKDGHIVAVVVRRALRLRDGILVDDLQRVVVDAFLIQQPNVLRLAGIPLKRLRRVTVLYPAGLFLDALVGVGDALLEEPLPLAIGKLVVVQLFQLCAEVGNEVRLSMDGQVSIAYLTQQADKLLFQLRLALITVRTPRSRRIFRHHGALGGRRDDVILAHVGTPFVQGSCAQFLKRQQLVPIVFVLLLPRFDFSRQSNVQVRADGIEVVEDISYAELHIQRRDYNVKLL